LISLKVAGIALIRRFIRRDRRRSGTTWWSCDCSDLPDVVAGRRAFTGPYGCPSEIFKWSQSLKILSAASPSFIRERRGTTICAWLPIRWAFFSGPISGSSTP